MVTEKENNQDSRTVVQACNPQLEGKEWEGGEREEQGRRKEVKTGRKGS